MRPWSLHWGLELQLACGPDSHLPPPQNGFSTAHSSEGTGAQQVCSTGLRPGVCEGLCLSISIVSLSEHTLNSKHKKHHNTSRERKEKLSPSFLNTSPTFLFCAHPWKLVIDHAKRDIYSMGKLRLRDGASSPLASCKRSRSLWRTKPTSCGYTPPSPLAFFLCFSAFPPVKARSQLTPHWKEIDYVIHAVKILKDTKDICPIDIVILQDRRY